MNYCYHYNRYREGEGVSLGLVALFFYIFLDGTISLFNASTWGQCIVSILIMLFGLSFSCIMGCVYLEVCRKYTITHDGLVLVYPFNFTVTHTWEDLSEIAVCKVHYTTRGPTEYMTAIRCVVGEEKNGPSKGYGWWADSLYSAIHFRKIITIIYSDERLDEFKTMCPLDIADYREMRRYLWDSV